MPQKKMKYVTKIEELPSNKIYINVNNMESGDYELNILNKNKLIKKTTFKKKWCEKNKINICNNYFGNRLKFMQ